MWPWMTLMVTSAIWVLSWSKNVTTIFYELFDVCASVARFLREQCALHKLCSHCWWYLLKCKTDTLDRLTRWYLATGHTWGMARRKTRVNVKSKWYHLVSLSSVSIPLGTYHQLYGLHTFIRNTVRWEIAPCQVCKIYAGTKTCTEWHRFHRKTAHFLPPEAIRIDWNGLMAVGMPWRLYPRITASDKSCTYCTE